MTLDQSSITIPERQESDLWRRNSIDLVRRILNHTMKISPIDPFPIRHRLVHNGGFPKFEALYCSLNMVKSTEISWNLSYKVQSSKSQSLKPIQKLSRFLNASAIMDQSPCCYPWRNRKQVYTRFRSKKDTPSQGEVQKLTFQAGDSSYHLNGSAHRGSSSVGINNNYYSLQQRREREIRKISGISFDILSLCDDE